MIRAALLFVLLGCAPEAAKPTDAVVFEMAPGNTRPWRSAEQLRDRFDNRGLDIAVTRVGSMIVVRVPGMDDDKRAQTAELATRHGAWSIHRVIRSERFASHVGDPTRDIRVMRAADGSAYLTAPDQSAYLPPGEARERGCFVDDDHLMPDDTVECWLSGRDVLEIHLAAHPSAAAGFVASERLPEQDRDTPTRWRTRVLATEPVLVWSDLEWAEMLRNRQFSMIARTSWTPDGQRKFETLAAQLDRDSLLGLVLDGRVYLVKPLRDDGSDGLYAASEPPASAKTHDEREWHRFVATESVVAVLRAGIPTGVRPRP